MAHDHRHRTLTSLWECYRDNVLMRDDEMRGEIPKLHDVFWAGIVAYDKLMHTAANANDEQIAMNALQEIETFRSTMMLRAEVERKAKETGGPES